MGHDGVASGYPIPTDFRRCQQDPRDRGVTQTSPHVHMQKENYLKGIHLQ